MNTTLRRLYAVLIAGLFLSLSAGLAHASSVTGYDLMYAVNTLRSQKARPPLEQNAALMRAAQVQAEYLAETYGKVFPSEIEAHVGQGGTSEVERAAAAGYKVTEGIAIQEIWAAASLDTSLNTIFSTRWANSASQEILLNRSAIAMGGGVAEADGYLYYVLVIAADYGAAVGTPTVAGNTVTRGTATPEVVPVITSTPEGDGSIWHTVVKGQALWSIAQAYGISVEQLQGLNNLVGNRTIYVGEKLLIRPKFTPTPEPTVTATPREPTRTPVPPLAPQPIATPVPLPASPSPFANMRSLGLLLVAVCGLGLAGLLLSGLIKKQ